MRKWTEEEINIAIEMLENNKPYKEIANKLERTHKSISKKMISLGYKKKYPYFYKVGEVVNGELKILKQIRVINGNYTCKGYFVKSLIHSKAPPYETREGNLKEGNGCIYERGLRIYEGNSLYSIENIRKNIIDKEQAKKIPPNYTSDKISFKCENKNCDNVKMMTPSHLVNHGFACENCSKNIPYGQLAFGQYQEYNNLGLKSEKVLKTLDNRRVDFVKFDKNNNVKYFVEIQGLQHTDVNHKWYEDAHEQDIAKRKWAKETNTLMIEIDMRVSSWSYFKEQINKCKHLPSINDEDEQVILELMEKNKRYPVKEIIELYNSDKKSLIFIGDKYKLDATTVKSILIKNNISIRNVKETNTRSVKCLTTNEIFPSISLAAKTYNIKSKGKISESINKNNNVKSAGKHPITGEKLYWEYVD